jgi:hypothetical protein
LLALGLVGLLLVVHMGVGFGEVQLLLANRTELRDWATGQMPHEPCLARWLCAAKGLGKKYKALPPVK